MILRLRRCRFGFTLVEALVTLGVIGLLAALLLPAVQQARESARRVKCTNNLKQIGIAIHAYHSLHNVFPASYGKPDRGQDKRITRLKLYSLHSFILAQLDQSNLFNSLNFDMPSCIPYPPPGARCDGYQANATVMSASLDVFLCPSDGGAGPPGWTGGVNYRANLGSERWNVPDSSPFMHRTVQLSAAGTTDGLSNTVAFSEKLRGGVGLGTLDFRSAMIEGGRGAPYSIDDSLDACMTLRTPSSPFFAETGLCWMVGDLSQTNYNHILEPNSPVPDCSLPLSTAGLIAARSNHPGGVNALFLDTSVRFVTNSVTRRTWRAMGTSSGGEIVDLPQP